MPLYRILLLTLALGFQALILGSARDVHAQDADVDSVSSDDISVAEGLQLPMRGRVWALDTWKDVQELIQLESGETISAQQGLSLKPHRGLEFKGEAARIRIHDTVPEFFLRRPAGQPTSASSPFAIVRLIVIGQNRQITQAASDDLVRERKGSSPLSPDLIELKQKRMGITNWYQLSPMLPLSADEYAIVPLPGSQGTSPDEMYDFAIDPQAPESPKAIHSERDRPVE
jgi:hypothetical protein